jgi:hypothetical protein
MSQIIGSPSLVCGQNIMTWKSWICALYFIGGHKHALKNNTMELPLLACDWMVIGVQWIVNASKMWQLDFIFYFYFSGTSCILHLYGSSLQQFFVSDMLYLEANVQLVQMALNNM